MSLFDEYYNEYVENTKKIGEKTAELLSANPFNADAHVAPSAAIQEALQAASDVVKQVKEVDPREPGKHCRDRERGKMGRPYDTYLILYSALAHHKTTGNAAQLQLYCYCIIPAPQPTPTTDGQWRWRHMGRGGRRGALPPPARPSFLHFL